MKGIEVSHFVVGSMRLPAAIQDAYPFVGKCAYGGLMSATLLETVVNTVHKAAPNASIAFNTRPEDTAEAAARWLNAD